MKRGDLVLVQARVQSVARDGSWIDVALPTLPPPGKRASYRAGSTCSGKKLGPDGWWTRATRVLSDAVYEDAPQVRL